MSRSQRLKMATESRGDALMADAEKTLNKFSFFGSSSKKEDASEKFAAAGNAYKITKQCVSWFCLAYGSFHGAALYECPSVCA